MRFEMRSVFELQFTWPSQHAPIDDDFRCETLDLIQCLIKTGSTSTMDHIPARTPHSLLHVDILSYRGRILIAIASSLQPSSHLTWSSNDGGHSSTNASANPLQNAGRHTTSVPRRHHKCRTPSPRGTCECDHFTHPGSCCRCGESLLSHSFPHTLHLFSMLTSSL